MEVATPKACASTTGSGARLRHAAFTRYELELISGLLGGGELKGWTAWTREKGVPATNS